MNAELTKRVWAAKCHPKIRSWKFVLLNLCYHANAYGEAFPGISTIADESGYTKRAVIDALAGLEAMGIIRQKGHCGQRKRVTVYDISRLSTSVDNLAKGEVSSPLELFNGEVSSKKGPFNGEVSSSNGEVSSPRSILGSKEVSKLVSIGGNGEVSSPFVDNSEKAGQNPPAEGSPPPHGSEPGKDAPSARNDGGKADRKRLMKTVGWKPKTDLDRQHCMYLCYMLGADHDEATRFVRFNAIRHWTCCEYGTVHDAAKQWVEAWRERDPQGWLAELERRRNADRILA